MRRKIIVGNWKMNKSPLDIKHYIKDFKTEIDKGEINCDFGIAISSINLVLVKYMLKNYPQVIISAQDAHYEKSGAFTGNDSWWQIKECGIKYAIIGHSERREMFNDTDEVVNKKVLNLLENDMVPILCVGENLEQREQGIHFNVVEEQLEKDLLNVNNELVSNVIIAYEPIWAIGTGKSASASDAQEMCQRIRSKIATMFDDEVATKIRILYGGSVNNTNAKEYLDNDIIDGALVGGASLDAIKFIELIREVK